MHVDDSACNLAVAQPDEVPPRRRHASTSTTSSTRSTSSSSRRRSSSAPSSYPTEEIGENARAFRQLGLGYANLGALLMANGLPVRLGRGPRDRRRDHRADDRPRLPQVGRDRRARSGPYDEYEREPRAAQPRDAEAPRRRRTRSTDELVDGEPARAPRGAAWDEAVELGEEHGYRNAQATVLAPTGTISLPDGLRHDRHRAGLLAGQVQGAGRRRPDDDRQPDGAAGARRRSATREPEIDQIEAYINEHGTIVGAPGLKDEHLPVFDVAVGERAISHMGHIKMMAAAQPFISGAISKTVNLPETATVEDIADAYIQGWKLGLKALAIYRDGSKTAQALRTDAGDKADAADAEAAEVATPQAGRGAGCRASASRSRTSSRSAATRATSRPACTRTASVGEIFLTDIGKEGSTLRGHDERVRDLDLDRRSSTACRSRRSCEKFSYMRFDPEGITGNPEIPFAKSMPDYIMRWLAQPLPRRLDVCEELGILTPEVRARKAAQQALMRGDTAGAGQRRRQRSATATATATATAEPRPAQPATTVAAAEAMTDTPPVDPGAAAGPGPRPGLRPVRRDDAAHRLLLHVLELRQQHRLRLM